MDAGPDVVELFGVKESNAPAKLPRRLDRSTADRQDEERRILESIEGRLEERACAGETPIAW